MKTKENTLDKLDNTSCLKVFSVFAFLMKWGHFGHQNEKEMNGGTISPLSLLDNSSFLV